MLSDDLKPYIDQIRRREITNRELAVKFNTHESYVCRVIQRMKIVRDAVVRLPSNKEINAMRAEHRMRVATTMSVKEAAKAAACSERTIYRLRSRA